MDSVFNDMEFLMGNIKQDTSNKQETSNTNEGAEPLVNGGQNNDAEQIAMSNYMTDFILDYINRTLKQEEEDEQNQQNNSVADGEDEEESVDDLIHRAESIIRENTQLNLLSNPEACISIPFLNDGQSVLENLTGNKSTNEQITNTALIPNVNAVHDVISVDTDSDDEVIFVNHQPSTIPVIDLSDHSEPIDGNIQSTSKRREGRKRTHNGGDKIGCDSTAVPAETPQEKPFRHNCGICLDDVKSPHSTICGHIYCRDCIKNAVKIFKKCPTCNKKLKANNVHPIYL